MSSPLPSENFVNQPRSDFVDTATLTGRNFDVDPRTGFMPPEPPINRLPNEWEPWEVILDRAMSMKVQLAAKPGLTEGDISRSVSWRESVRRNLPILSTTGLRLSELLLRRAHHVLAFIMHMYIHTLPLDAEIRIPPNISIPLIEVSAHLQIPPIATHADTVIYNWALKSHTNSDVTSPPAFDNLRMQSLFSGTNDEQEFYLCTSRIEFKGAEALEIVRVAMDEMLVDDENSVGRVTGYLCQLASVVNELKDILLSIRKGCNPEVFYHSVRPWFRGEDADPVQRKWIFEGLDERPDLEYPIHLSGPSAGQSTLIQALDIFLGVDNCDVSKDAELDDKGKILRRMQIYMPRHHRDFLSYLAANPKPVRNLVIGGDPKLVQAYNEAVKSVKEFRDAHFRIVALYIIGPASRERRMLKEAGVEEKKAPLTGTGGTHLAQFLKGVRDQTTKTMLGAL